MKRITRANVTDRAGNKYCGPLVLAALLGTSTAEAAGIVRGQSGRRAIRGMYHPELITALRANGYDVVEEAIELRYRAHHSFGGGQWYTNEQDPDMPPGHRGAPFTPVKRVGPTFAEWLRSRQVPSATHIVVVSNHYVLVQGRKMVDTHTHGVWTFIRSAPHRRKRVEKVFRIIKL